MSKKTTIKKEEIDRSIHFLIEKGKTACGKENLRKNKNFSATINSKKITCKECLEYIANMPEKQNEAIQEPVINEKLKAAYQARIDRLNKKKDINN